MVTAAQIRSRQIAIAARWKHEAKYPALWSFSTTGVPTQEALADCQRAIQESAGWRQSADVVHARGDLRRLIIWMKNKL